jgi:hypothetical protein
MRRALWFLLFAVLVADLSGAAELLTPETCVPGDTSRPADATCPPTCARCVCCAQPVVQVDSQTTVAIEPFVPLSQPLVLGALVLLSHDIFHVPKRS